MTSQVSNYFYHSFPRRRHGEDPIKKGIDIIECIARLGFVLAPEIIQWKQPLANGTDRLLHTLQQRLSFTEISRRHLKKHAAMFGPFALEFEVTDLRRLGAVPVFYIPQPLPEKPGLSAIGMTLVVQMFDAQYTLNILDKLKKDSESTSEIVILGNSNNYGLVEKYYFVPRNVLADIIQYLWYRNAPFDMMRGVVHAASGLFCPTDNLIHDKLLDYYRQREWRLIGHIRHISDPEMPFSRELRPEEAQLLRLTSPDFWDREIAGGNLRFRRIEQALVFQKFEDRHVLEFARRILVPKSACAATKQILRAASLDVPVASL